MPKLGMEAFLERAREIESEYRPSAETLRKISDVSLVTISGPTGAGKDTIRKRLHGIPKVVSETVRPPQVRNGQMEQDGVDYHFQHEKLGKVLDGLEAGKYVQFTMGPEKKRFYGSRPKHYPAAGPAIMDVMTDQLPTLRERFESGVCSIYLVPPSKLWLPRLMNRGELSDDELQQRRLEARVSLSSALADNQSFFVLNEDMRRAADESRRVIDAVVAQRDPLEDPWIDFNRQEQAREAAQFLLFELCVSNLNDLVPSGQ